MCTSQNILLASYDLEGTHLSSRRFRNPVIPQDIYFQNDGKMVVYGQDLSQNQVITRLIAKGNTSIPVMSVDPYLDNVKIDRDISFNNLKLGHEIIVYIYGQNINNRIEMTTFLSTIFMMLGRFK